MTLILTQSVDLAITVLSRTKKKKAGELISYIFCYISRIESVIKKVMALFTINLDVNRPQLVSISKIVDFFHELTFKVFKKGRMAVFFFAK